MTPEQEATVQRVLDREARRLLAEELEQQSAENPPHVKKDRP